MKASRGLLFAAILLLIFPGYAAGQNENQTQPASISEGADQQIDAETFYFLLESAEQGSPSAQFRLGMIYLQGNSVARDLSEAEKWFRKAAEQGNNPAKGMLGVIYATGMGVTKDYIQAYMWLTLAIDETKDKQAPFLPQATELRNTIVEEMTPQQIDEARELAEKRKSVRLISPKEISGSVLRSKLIQYAAPDYPPMALRDNVQGTVTLKVTVDEGGNVKEIEVVEGNPLLNTAAVDAVKQWKYTPTLVDGIPIPVIATVTVHFRRGR
ncbi:MAG: TonB family protein [Acidobacteria bacterium]|nr:TonB family protein [Acidobacteriota bacterium]